MKINLLLNGLISLMLAGTVSATIVVDQTWGVGQMIPDSNPTGFITSQTFSGLSLGDGNQGINGVRVNLNISGGYNGDLYGYLVLQSADTTTTSVLLLNRIGQDMSHAYGNSGSGISVTLSTGGTDGDIHNAAFGSVTGNYTPDGNATALNALNGRDANGTWTLFLADLSGGDMSQLVSWGVNVSVVPEPVTWALIGFGGLVGVAAMLRRREALKILPGM